MDVKGFFDEYRWLSNFWYAPIALSYKRFDTTFYAPTNEHAYQAMKMQNLTDFSHILSCHSPIHARKLGKAFPIVENWDAVKDEIMYKINLAKYKQHAELRNRLLLTGYLEETNTWHDTYWGNCICGNCSAGLNTLGHILMRIREELS